MHETGKWDQRKSFVPVAFWLIVTALGGVRGQSAEVGWVGLIKCSGCDVICDPLSGERSLSQFFLEQAPPAEQKWESQEDGRHVS